MLQKVILSLGLILLSISSHASPSTTDYQVHLSGGAALAQPSIGINASLQADGKLQRNKPANFFLSLTDANGKPIELKDLTEIHTQKIHLFITDPSISDYYHEHPLPTDEPGIYQFSVTPQRSGDYKLFVEVTPTATGATQYIPQMFTVSGEPDQVKKNVPINSGTIQHKNQQDGLIFTTSVTQSPIKVGEANQMNVVVTTSAGEPFTQLEPIMGAFAHVAGFDPTRREIDHLHPLGPEPKNDADRGGPELNFHFKFNESGFHRLFVQVQVSGKQIIVPFDVLVV